MKKTFDVVCRNYPAGGGLNDISESGWSIAIYVGRVYLRKARVICPGPSPKEPGAHNQEHGGTLSG